MLIPDNIKSFDSNGEKILYLRFKNDGSTQKMYVLHSLFTNYHFKNISGELDFLVLSPNEGIFAIEVKHGKVSRKEGTWIFENRFGEETKKTKSPFAQVDGTMNSIRKYVLDKIKYKKGIYDKLSKILWGTGVAFTSMDDFFDFGTEAHSWQILNREGLAIPIGYYVNSLSKGWHDVNKGKYWYDTYLSRPTINDCELILQILRGDFDIDYSEINRIVDNEYLIEEFTKEQFGLLEFVSHNNRCLIEGSAGTGKTLMALEIAQREINSGKKIALFCFNKRLGGRLNKALSIICDIKEKECFAGTLHSFILNNVENDSLTFESDKFFSDELPLEFLIQNENFEDSEKFDMIIIDEAQDLLTPYYLEVFDLILKDGIENGKWVFFGDFTNQAIYLNDPTACLNLLSKKSMFTKFPPLKINCRNTQKIADQNTLLTGVERSQFKSNSQLGDHIIHKFPTKTNQLEIIEDILNDLLSKGIPAAKICLLSPKKEESTFLTGNKLISKLKKEGLEFSTIQAYKGLENTVIILFDFDEIESDESQRLLYIGVSRARQLLYIVLKNSLKISYQLLLQKNFSKLN